MRYLDVQTFENIMIQLLKKCERVEANDLRCWFLTIEKFLSKITCAFAEKFLQIDKLNSFQMTIILIFEVCFSRKLKEKWFHLVDINHVDLLAEILYDELINRNFLVFNVFHWLSMQLHTLFFFSICLTTSYNRASSSYEPKYCSIHNANELLF